MEIKLPDYFSDDSKPLNALRIFAIRGRGLPVMDKNLFSKGGSSDPMATFELCGERVASQYKSKTLAPVWTSAVELTGDFELVSEPIVFVSMSSIRNWHQM